MVGSIPRRGSRNTFYELRRCWGNINSSNMWKREKAMALRRVKFKKLRHKCFLGIYILIKLRFSSGFHDKKCCVATTTKDLLRATLLDIKSRSMIPL